jgi:hypothetical protein
MVISRRDAGEWPHPVLQCHHPIREARMSKSLSLIIAMAVVGCAMLPDAAAARSGHGKGGPGGGLPHGFSEGRKAGWHGNVPPGWSKGRKTGWTCSRGSTGCRPPGLR